MDQQISPEQPKDYRTLYSTGELLAKALDRLAQTAANVSKIRHRFGAGFPNAGESDEQGLYYLNLRTGEIEYPDGSWQSFMDNKGIIQKKLPKEKNPRSQFMTSIDGSKTHTWEKFAQQYNWYEGNDPNSLGDDELAIVEELRMTRLYEEDGKKIDQLIKSAGGIRPFLNTIIQNRKKRS